MNSLGLSVQAIRPCQICTDSPSTRSRWIDPSFRISKIARIARTVIGLGRGLKVPVLAEGVETNEQLRFLISEACAEIQGYLVGKPRSMEGYADLVGIESQHRAAPIRGQRCSEPGRDPLQSRSSVLGTKQEGLAALQPRGALAPVLWRGRRS
jgi:hypothetical protein